MPRYFFQFFRIPEDRLNEVFERFTQVESGYTKNFEGSGLGLTIAQTAINGHQGIIECDSEPGRTRFSIYLPIKTLVHLMPTPCAQRKEAKETGGINL